MKRAVLALALVGCSPPPCETCPTAPAEVEIAVCVDSAFTDAERDAIDAACARWTAALCGLVTLQPLPVDGYDPPDWCDVAVLQPQGELAYAADRGAVSTLAPTVAFVPAGETEPDVYAHELGHALGVAHGGGIMAGTIRYWGGCVDRRAAVMAAMGVGQ